MARITIPQGREIPALPENAGPYWTTHETRYSMHVQITPITSILRSVRQILFQSISENIVMQVRRSVPAAQSIADTAVSPV